MKKALIVLIILMCSCSPKISPYQKQKTHHYRKRNMDIEKINKKLDKKILSKDLKISIFNFNI